MTRAGRIHTILSQLHNYPNQPLISAWGSIFNTQDPFTIYYMLEKLDHEIMLFEEECIENNIDVSFYKLVVDQSKKMVRLYNFETSATIVRQNLPLTTLERLYGMSIYGSSENDVSLDLDDDVAKMKNTVEDLQDKDLKYLLESLVKLLENTETVLKINGAQGLHEMIQLLYCKTSANIDTVKKAPKEYISAFVRAYKKIKKGLNETQYAMALPEKATRFLDDISNFLS